MTEQPTPDQTGTWEIDWDEMVSSADGATGGWEFPDSIHRIAQAIIAAYRRQQAEHGRVEVQREHLCTLRENIAFLADWMMVNDATTDIENALRSFVRGLDFALDPGPFADLAAVTEES
jgi:hypothetical protein